MNPIIQIELTILAFMVGRLGCELAWLWRRARAERRDQARAAQMAFLRWLTAPTGTKIGTSHKQKLGFWNATGPR